MLFASLSCRSKIIRLLFQTTKFRIKYPDFVACKKWLKFNIFKVTNGPAQNNKNVGPFNLSTDAPVLISALWFLQEPFVFSESPQKRPTTPSVLHVNERSVCAFPLPGNPVTSDCCCRWVVEAELCALSGCQLRSMDRHNYRFWINRVLLLARAMPRLIFLADNTYTAHKQKHMLAVQGTNRSLCGCFKEPKPLLVASNCPETQQTPHRPSDDSSVCSAVL